MNASPSVPQVGSPGSRASRWAGRVRLAGWLALCVGCAGLVVHILAGATLAEQVNRAGVVSAVVSVVAIPFSTRTGRDVAKAAARYIAYAVRRIAGPPSPPPPPSPPIGRRQALVLAASVIVAPAALHYIGQKIAGTVATHLRGAVWPQLFRTDDNRLRSQWQGLADELTVKDLSGMELLAQTSAQIAELDFVVCPSPYIRAVFVDARRKQGRPIRRSRSFLSEDMVVLGKRAWLEALCRAEYVIRAQTGTIVFDLARYVHRYRDQTWATIDPQAAKDANLPPGDPITLHSPDPATSSSGQNFLISLVWTLDNDASNPRDSSGHVYPDGTRFADARPLWNARGPLRGHLYEHSTDLWDHLPALGLIYTYEHLARTTLEGPDGSAYFAAQVNPKCTCEQTLVGLKPAADTLDDRLALPTTLPPIALDLHLPYGAGHAQTAYLEEGDVRAVEERAANSGRPLKRPQPVRWNQRSLPEYQKARMDKVYAEYLADRRPTSGT